MTIRAMFLAAFVATISIIPVHAEASTLSIAKKYVGLHERANRSSLKRMIGIDPARVPWCGAWAGFVVRKAGRKPPKGHNMARSWLRFGKAVKMSSARPGDVVVLRTRGGAIPRFHVGLLYSKPKGRICLIGGNQRNQVQLSCYAAGNVKAVRR